MSPAVHSLFSSEIRDHCFSRFGATATTSPILPSRFTRLYGGFQTRPTEPNSRKDFCVLCWLDTVKSTNFHEPR